MAGWKHHLRRAVAHLGSQPLLARAIGCSQSKISWLLKKAEKLDAKDALLIARAASGAVRHSQLRPDLWPAATALRASSLSPAQASPSQDAADEQLPRCRCAPRAGIGAFFADDGTAPRRWNP